MNITTNNYHQIQHVQPVRKKNKAARPKGLMHGREVTAPNPEDASGDQAIASILAQIVFNEITEGSVKALQSQTEEMLKPSSPIFMSSELETLIGSDEIFDTFRSRSNEWVIATSQKMIVLHTDIRDPLSKMVPLFISVMNGYPVRTDERNIREQIRNHPGLKELVKTEDVHIVRGDNFADEDEKVDWVVVSESSIITVVETNEGLSFEVVDTWDEIEEMAPQGSPAAWQEYAENAPEERMSALILQCLGVDPRDPENEGLDIEDAFRRGDYDKVLADYNNCDPIYTESYWKDFIAGPWCAAAYALKGEYDLAIEFYTRTLDRIEESHTNIPFGNYYRAEAFRQFYAERALVYALKGDKTEATRDLEHMHTQEEVIREIARSIGDLSFNPPSEAEKLIYFLELI